MVGDDNPGEPSSPAYSLLWERIYARTCRMVLSLAKRYRIPPQEVEDLQQDAFYRIQRSLRRFDAARGKASLASWMYRQARWEVMEHFRRRGRTPPSVQPGDEGAEFPESVDPGESPPEFLARTEEERAEKQARKECVDSLREPLRTRYYARLPGEGQYRTRAEAARFLGLSEDTMRESIRKAAKFLRSCMEKKGFTTDPPHTSGPDGIEE